MKITIKKTTAKKMMCGGKAKKMEMGGMAGPGDGIFKKDKNKCWDGKAGKICKSTNVPSGSKKKPTFKKQETVKVIVGKPSTKKSTIFSRVPKDKSKPKATMPKFESYR